MSSKIINDEALLAGVEKLEDYLKTQKQFEGIQFLLWEQLVDPCVRAKLYKNNETKILAFSKQYYNAIVDFNLPPNANAKYNQLTDEREKLIEEAFAQFESKEWLLE